MAQAQAGEKDAYRRFLTEILPYLRRVIASQTGGADVVEDILQDSLISIHRARHTYDPGRPIRPWLAAIARRRCLDHLRTQGRRIRLAAALIAAGEPPSQGSAPSGTRALEHRELRAEIEKLPARQRQALQRLKLEEMSLEEAAADTGQTIGSLKVAVHRGIASLRERLKVGDDER